MGLRLRRLRRPLLLLLLLLRLRSDDGFGFGKVEKIGLRRGRRPGDGGGRLGLRRFRSRRSLFREFGRWLVDFRLRRQLLDFRLVDDLHLSHGQVAFLFVVVIVVGLLLDGSSATARIAFWSASRNEFAILVLVANPPGEMLDAGVLVRYLVRARNVVFEVALRILVAPKHHFFHLLRLPFVEIDGTNEGYVCAKIPVESRALDAHEDAQRG